MRLSLIIGLSLALAGIAMLVFAVLSDAPRTLTPRPRMDDIDPAGCINEMPFRVVIAEPGVLRFVAENVADPPRRLDGLRYAFEIAGAEDPQDPPPPDGSLADAAVASEDAAVRYVDRAGDAGTFDSGDELVLRARGGFNLRILDASGMLVGGTWGCA